MTEPTPDAKRSYPYMSVQTWHAIRMKLKAKMPRTLDNDWIVTVLGVSEKAAANILPQLRAIGLVGSEGMNQALIDDLRDDATYVAACHRIADSLYPAGLRDTLDGTAELETVRGWFMRNARTSENTAALQARFYLAMVRADMPNGDEPVKIRTRTTPPTKAVKEPKGTTERAEEVPPPPKDDDDPPPPSSPRFQQGPALHIDLQIHIAADADPDQIEAIFASMAKHLYGRE
ncbi:MAG: hypothetical protein JWP95_1515 [Actinotalea sp.]|nr:hypothetical protein [Actinotalea sp.]